MSACPACAKPIDPLRAGRVAIFGERFYYFCDAGCRQRFAPESIATPAAEKAAHGFPPAGPRVAAGEASSGASAAEPTSARKDGGAVPGAPAPPSPESSRPSSLAPERIAPRPEVGSGLLWAGAACGALAVSLGLAGATQLVVGVRVACAAVGWICVAAQSLRAPRAATEVPPWLLLAPGLAASLVAGVACFVQDPGEEHAAAFAGVVVAGLALTAHLVDRAGLPLARERARIAVMLSAAAQRSPEQGGASDVKAGEEIDVAAGDVLAVDAQLVAGQIAVVPWLGAGESVRRQEGDSLLAGARIVSGRARVRATYAGFDRAWARLTLDPRRRADVHARIARFARAVAARGGVVAALLAGLAVFANGEQAVEVALAAIAAYAAVTTAAVGSVAAVHVGRGVLEGLRRGVAYRSPPDWDRAGDVSIAAFCARGTLLLGEPELADLEAVGKWGEEQVLALAACAENTSTHPVAMAIQRAANARGIRPDAVRSPSVQNGLGVLAVASTGEALTVGSRALMLKEKISVAVAEQKIAEIEAHGREVLLVALAGRLAGVLGLQDGLRPGARAAVQHLLDAQVEPVLISGDSRETCEAIGRALDIEHIRPEILLADRAAEVERLAHSGGTVAVLGRPRADEAALSAADVAVAMPGVGSASGEWGVMLASDDVRDGALAISLARRTKNDARTGLILAVAPGIACAVVVGFGLLPALYAPLAAFLGAVVSTLHARATDLSRAAAPQGVDPRISEYARAESNLLGARSSLAPSSGGRRSDALANAPGSS